MIDAITDAISSLARQYRPAHILLVGHSGGATIAADVRGRHPEVANAAVLVSCPCNVRAFRAHMSALQHNPLWQLPARSLSPTELASSVDRRSRVSLVVGADDEIAPPPLSRGYTTKLRQSGIDVSLTELPGAGHEILLDRRVQIAINATLAEIRAAHRSQCDGGLRTVDLSIVRAA